MKWLHCLTGFLLALIVTVCGAVLVYGNTFGHSYWLAFLDYVRGERLASLATGAALLLLVVIYAMTSVRRKRGEQFISFDGGKGLISINARAVKDIIQKVEDEFAAILSLQPILDLKKGGLFVELNVRVASGTQIPELCQMLQDRVMECIHDQLGLSELKGIKVNVQEIINRPAEVKSAREEGAK